MSLFGAQKKAPFLCVSL